MKLFNKFDDVHKKLIDSLMPLYGHERIEVIQQIVFRWLDENIMNGRIRKLKGEIEVILDNRIG